MPEGQGRKLRKFGPGLGWWGTGLLLPFYVEPLVGQAVLASPPGIVFFKSSFSAMTQLISDLMTDAACEDLIVLAV
ncbi:MAG: hypothetical protein LBT47_04605 [Deltaproteobacteria bacterium]|jgi:hypothetical protein|nr:hypothetical protein [Deltaproteobacteria bacterium]